MDNPRRSFSLPPPRSYTSPDPQVEVLFNLPSVRIIAFSTTSPSVRPESRSGSPAVEDKPGTLPWVSRVERTLAVGPLRIYRAPGSVAFLNCASALRPILPKSQSWCVDREGTFVLQIRRPEYWRIEVPSNNEEEKARVTELKSVLSQVLLFEKTPCPFKRDFVVELPEAPKTPVTRRPWRPVQGPQLFSSPSYGNKSINDDDSRSSRASSPRAQSPAATPQRTQQSPQRPPTPMRSPSKSSVVSADVKVPQKQAPKPDNLSPPHSPLATPPANPPVPSTPLRQTSMNTSPPCTPDKSRVSALSSATPRATGAESLTAVAEEEDGGSTRNDRPRNVHIESDDSGFTSETTEDSNDTPTGISQPEFEPHQAETESCEKPQAMRNTARSTTAPPILSLITSPPSKQRSKSPPRDSALSEESSSQSSTVGSFHSLHSWHSPLDPTSPGSPQSSSESPSYPYPHDNIVLPKRSNNHKNPDFVVETPGAWKSPPASDDGDSSSMCQSPQPKTPVLDGSNFSPHDDQIGTASPTVVETTIRHRATTSSNSRRRELSPLPAAVNLFSPPPARRSRRLQTTRHLPTAIIQKTCEILLSPPSHLFTLMISVASKIAAGEWRGFLFSGYGEEVHWDFEDEYGRSPYSPEDDYGVTLPRSSLPRKPKSNASDAGGSWEVD